MNYANRKGQDLLHTPEGVRDCYGKENYAKQNTIEKIADQIHLYGYEDLQTPSFEYFDVFSNEIGTTSSRELYKFFDKTGTNRSQWTQDDMSKYQNYIFEMLRDYLPKEGNN